ncbi:MAG: hypothetical protein J1F02_02550 [Lachnospiraceae bacterium]|nr:hypothetical protein [Lachnospiraceae bacterium]
MSDFYGIGGLGSSSFFDSYFGSSNYSSSNNSNLTSSILGGSNSFNALGDLTMIRSGAYKKALKSYYAIQKSDDKESISGSGKADSNNKLSLVKSTAKSLNESAKKLQNIDYKKATTEDIMDDVKSFVSDYNSMLNSTKNLNSYSILQTTVWASDQMQTAKGLLDKVGITVNADNTLALDEEKFKSANMGDIKALFSGSSSLASRIAQKASTISNQSANQLSINSGRSLYTMYGTLL